MGKKYSYKPPTIQEASRQYQIALEYDRLDTDDEPEEVEAELKDADKQLHRSYFYEQLKDAFDAY